MDLVSHRLSVCVWTICLLGVARSSNYDDIKCPCSEIRQLSLTKPPPGTCFQTRFRYTCVDGYLRKAGTSDLIKCKLINGAPQWTNPSLQCIPDPRRTTTKTTVTSVPAAPHLGESGTSAPVATETYGTVSTSPGVHTDQTTSNSSNNSNTPHVSTHTDHALDKTTTLAIVSISLVIITLIGVGYACYRRRSRNEPASKDETMSMNPVTSEAVIEFPQHDLPSQRAETGGR